MVAQKARHYPNIRAYRVINAKSQEEVAESLDISLGTYNQKEQGKREFTSTELRQLAELFKCTTDNLLKDKEIKV